MSLPWEKHKMPDQVIVSHKAEGGEAEASDMPELENAMEDLMHALNNKDFKAAAMAFHAACKLCEMYEGEEES